MADHPSGRRRSLWLGPTNPARRKRRTAVCAVLLPLLLAALLLVLDFPFLTAQGALAATKSGTPSAPGGHCPVQPPAGGHAPVTVLHRPRRGLVRLVQRGAGRPVLAPGALTAACPDGEAPLAILASPAFGGRGQELTVVSGGPDVVAVEVDYLSGFDLPLRLTTARREAGRSVLFFTLEDPYHGLP